MRCWHRSCNRIAILFCAWLLGAGLALGHIGGQGRDILLPVTVGDEVGYINRDGELVIEPKVMAGSRFRGDYANVLISTQGAELHRVLDRAGNIVSFPDRPGTPIKWLGWRFVLEDAQGNLAVWAPETDRATDFVFTRYRIPPEDADRMIPVQRDGRWGYLDEHLELVIDLRFLIDD